MEIEKLNHCKTQRLKVRADSTIEEVNKQLEFTEEIVEFQTSISCYTGFVDDIFTQLNLALLNQKDLKKLNISFKFLHNLTFEDTIYKLKDIQQITSLILSFQEDFQFSNSQSRTFCDCLFQFPNLRTLEIKISSNFIDSEIELFEFYQSKTQLTSILFEVSQVQEKVNIFHSLFRGLRFQKNLQSFKLLTHSCSKIRTYDILDLLEEEFKESDNIQIFDLEFRQKIVVASYDFIKLGNLLKNLTKLEKLFFTVYSSQRESGIKIIGYEDDLLTLTNLKELNLKFKSEVTRNWTTIVSNITQMECLQSVKLEFNIGCLSQIDNDMVSFSQSLAKIKYLELLNIKFNCKTNAYEVIKFIIQLKPAEHLKELKVYIHFIENSASKNEYEHFEYTEFIEVIKNLEKYTFIMRIDEQFDDRRLIDNIFSSIQNAAELKSILVGFRGSELLRIQTQQLNIDDILSNKMNLQSICFIFQTFLLIEESHLINVFERLQYNPRLSLISLQFKNNINFSYALLQKLSESLICLNELKDLIIIIDNHHSQLNNEGFDYFADSLSKLKVLKQLQLIFSKDSVSLSALNHLLSSLRNLKKLQVLGLRIDGNSFENDEDEKSFGDSFEFSKKLKKLELSLQIKNLQYKNMRNLIHSISTESKLEQLILKTQLASNHEECKEILHCFLQLKNIQNLVFLNYSMSMLMLSSLLNQLPPLKVITLDKSYLPSFFSSVEAKKKLIEKRKLEYSLNQETQKDVKDFYYYTSLKIMIEQLLNDEIKRNSDLILPYIFQNLSFLNELHVNLHTKNKIGVELSSQFLKNLSLLQYLNCLKIQIKGCNEIGSESLNALGTTLTQLKLLESFGIEIEFCLNSFDISESLSFYKDLSTLTQLEQLDIKYYFANGGYGQGKNKNIRTVEILFESLKTLINLKNLKLLIMSVDLNQEILNQFHSLCGSLKQKLTTFSFHFVFLDMEQKKLTEIAQAIKQLDKLHVLSVNKNCEALRKLLRLVSYKKV